MAKTLMIMLMSGNAENEDALFAARLAKAVLKRGDKVNIFLYGNGVNLAKKDHLIEGDLHIAKPLLDHIENRRTSKYLKEDLLEGVKVIPDEEVATIIEECESVAVF